MPHVQNRETIVVAAALLAGLVACTARKDSRSTVDSAGGSVAASPAMPPDSATAMSGDSTTTLGATSHIAMPPGPSTDATILGEARDADSDEVMIGRMAETKATSAAVKAYAKLLVGDHTREARKVDTLTATLGILLPTDVKAADASTALTRLSALNPGKMFDTAFVNYEVMDHQEELTSIRQSMSGAQAPEVKAMAKTVEAEIQRHLARAQEIQAQLAKGS